AASYVPDLPGVASFKGRAFHASRWPREGIHFDGLRVAVIGTGSTGVQLIPCVAKEAARLTVFQRTPNYCGPLHNAEVSPELQQEWKRNYRQIMQKCRQSPAGFLFDFDMRRTMDVPKQERLALYEYLWGRPGFEKWLANFFDITIDAE